MFQVIPAKSAPNHRQPVGGACRVASAPQDRPSWARSAKGSAGQCLPKIGAGRRVGAPRGVPSALQVLLLELLGLATVVGGLPPVSNWLLGDPPASCWCSPRTRRYQLPMIQIISTEQNSTVPKMVSAEQAELNCCKCHVRCCN